jgi:hypothetical protein
MRTSMAYFAGAGTVVAAIAAGLGGGFVLADVMSPQAARQLGKVELQAKAQQSPQPNAAQSSPQPSPVTASNGPQTPVPYLAQVQPAANAPVVVGTASQKQPQPQSKKQNETANAAPPAKTSDPPAKRDDVAAAKRDDAPKAKQAEQMPSQPATNDEASTPENVYAKTRDADLKRQVDKRKDRRQQWATRRQQQRDQEMRDVEDQVREDRGPRDYIVRRDDSDRRDFDRTDFGRPTGFDFPRINFFGPD